jgi:hypothetical protein
MVGSSPVTKTGHAFGLHLPERNYSFQLDPFTRAPD